MDWGAVARDFAIGAAAGLALYSVVLVVFTLIV